MADHGRFIYYDFLTRDGEATYEFFSKVVGYGQTRVEMEPVPYLMLSQPDTGLHVGGIITMLEPEFGRDIPPNITGYIRADDIEETCSAIEKHGGTVQVPPSPAGNLGRFAVIQDPCGARISAWQEFEPFDRIDGGHGAIEWNELLTTDYEKAFDFYAAVFGWDVKEDMDMGDAGVYRLYGLPGQDEPMGGMFNKTDDMPMPPSWVYYITVNDLDGAVNAVKTNGGTVMIGPIPVPAGGRIAQCTAPDGLYFALYEKSS